MISSLSEFNDFQQALECKEHTLPYNFASILSTESWGAKRLSKMKFKMLKSFDSLLSGMLEENEQVFYISYGVQSSVFEQMFMGWMVYYLNRRAFVFTNKRILVIQVKGKFVPWDLLSQIPYENIKAVKRLFANIRIVFTNGKSAVFSGMPGADRKNVPMITEKIREKKGIDTSATPGAAEKLCPYCFAVTDGFPAACPQCNGSFKSAKKAGLLSLLFPGIGDVYLGHRIFGTMEIIGTAIFWIVLLMPVDEDGNTVALSTRLVLAVFFFFIVHGIDALVTFRTGRKGIYPAKPGTADK